MAMEATTLQNEIFNVLRKKTANFVTNSFKTRAKHTLPQAKRNKEEQV